ncbi:hypothetical protein [uncultured Desulfovibrio sp.]|uniref:hypothetical protein n=1 Tax=uncultured Desulfovibrio sp. TaxID=167968 RepID=UPI00280452DB|nr:hypothetical protein [uncultured Desulfovibrio sp.]
MTDKNRPVTPPARKKLFLTDDFGMAESRHFSHQWNHSESGGLVPSSIPKSGRFQPRLRGGRC